MNGLQPGIVQIMNLSQPFITLGGFVQMMFGRSPANHLGHPLQSNCLPGFQRARERADAAAR